MVAEGDAAAAERAIAFDLDNVQVGRSPRPKSRFAMQDMAKLDWSSAATVEGEVSQVWLGDARGLRLRSRSGGFGL